jgi:heme/copper-type cytochrome/quinol oxidase subunit 3
VQWPPAGIPEPKALAPLLLGALLVSTSVPVQLAYAAARRGRLRPARRLLLGAFAVQAAYLGLQVHLLLGDLARFAPSEHAYASIYYVLLGAGHAHVAAGLLFEAFLLAKLARGLTRYRLAGLQSAAFYWHFVNVLTIAVVATQLSPRL